MHRSWNHLQIQNESELKDPARLKRILRSSNVDLIMAILFGLGSAILLGLSGFFVKLAFESEHDRWSFLFAALFLFVMAPLFGLGAKLFYKNRSLNPIRKYLQNPEGFEFTSGEIVNFRFISQGKRSSEKIMAEIRGKSKLGKPLVVIEQFKPQAWPFTTQENEKALKSGDDWYELKGKRPLLPVPVYLLINENFPAAFVGIEKRYLVV